MDWMDQNLPDDLAIAVVNETGSRTTANVGCRAGGDVLFVDRVTLEPGGRREWAESVAGPVEIGVQVRGGPEATERFDPTDGSGRVSAAIAAGSISFSTAGGRGASGGAGTAGTGGGVDSFAAAETSGGDFGDDRDDGWGFGDDGTDAGDSWGFDEATTGGRSGGEDDSVAGSGDTDGADTSTSTPGSGAGSGAATDSGWGFGDDETDEGDESDTGGDTAEPGATADADAGPSGTADAATGTDGERGGSRRESAADADTAASRRTGTRGSETGERQPDREPSEADPERGSGDREVDSGGSSGSADATADSGGAEPARNDGENRTADATAAGASGRADDTDGGSSPTAGAGEMYCSSCGSVIKEQAELCPECGVRQSDTSASTSGSKDKTSAALLAIFLGFIGAHHFYLGNTGRGILYLLLSWTLIPGTIALIEAVIYLTKSEEEFQRKYG
ncbi:NINE protein [Halobaculum roseum]|uniref:NINE protein n=1 Tax=Halobaculum roseum TaxID=2175149 RepID=A0ABD5MR25_9EURY|nr:NINE protein [Halobaculum roseum]QZY01409.1 NINE protein [Halobaculum roseum]